MRLVKTLLISMLCAQLTYATPLDNLAGIITNPYNVRNDILLYINHTVEPFSHPWRLFVKIASNQQFLYYHAKTYAEAQGAVQQNSIAMRCLSKEYQANEEYLIFKRIDAMMQDTPERRKHIFDASNKFFGPRGWKHPKLNRKELEGACNSGDYA